MVECSMEDMPLLRMIMMIEPRKVEASVIKQHVHDGLSFMGALAAWSIICSCLVCGATHATRHDTGRDMEIYRLSMIVSFFILTRRRHMFAIVSNSWDV